MKICTIFGKISGHKVKVLEIWYQVGQNLTELDQI